MSSPVVPSSEQVVSATFMPRGSLPPLRERHLPEPVSIRAMIGPSIMLAGLALGSGEFIFWPKLTFQNGFVFFWACLLGVFTQYFMNMEIARWTLATGESAITGFCRLNRHWAWAFLVCNIVPWMIPAWATGSAELLSWLCFGAELRDGVVQAPYKIEIAVASLFLCGIVLTAGPVIYETVERIQLVLVTFIMVAVIVLAALVVRADAVFAQVQGSVSFGLPAIGGDVTVAALLGAIAFAGVGGTLNLGHSNYVKDKGYGMGRYIGRITSPVTGKDEPVSEFGYHFPHTPENLARWRVWWHNAGWEHFCSFFLTCLVCLTLLTLISYSLFYGPDGARLEAAKLYEKDMAFVWGESLTLARQIGSPAKLLFLAMGVAILFTTELGVLDAASRISMDIVKVNWLGKSVRWTESRLYYAFLWGTILVGAGVLLAGADGVKQSFFLFKLTASLNGGVMFVYCVLLIVLNRRLPGELRLRGFRLAMMCWAVLFFGFFAGWACWAEVTNLTK